jgi:hypothetical protein
MQLNDLIDRAAGNAGSDNKLAIALGVSRQVVSNWRHGLKTATPADWALLAAAAGLDPEEALIRATLDKHAGTPKGERLMKALGKGLHQIGAVALLGIFAATFGLLTPTDAKAGLNQMRDNVYYVNY